MYSKITAINKINKMYSRISIVRNERHGCFHELPKNLEYTDYDNSLLLLALIVRERYNTCLNHITMHKNT